MKADLHRKYRCQYRMYWRFDRYAHSYEVVGRWGAVQLDISSHGKNNEPSAGLEIHCRQPFSYQANDAPHHDECWLTKGLCWHDGTSMYAMEHWLPLHARLSPDEVLELLCAEADERFSEFEGGEL